MADVPRTMRIVPQPGEEPPGRRKRPGPAVALVLLYASLFGAGLLWIRARSPLLRAQRERNTAPPRAGGTEVAPLPGSIPSSAAAASRPDEVVRRAALLSGDGLPTPARAEYGRRISAERCTCGCDLPLRTCLAQDRACARSPELAEKVRDSLR